MSVTQGAPTTAVLEQVRAALNLGWSMAELRGRIRYGHVEPPGTVDYQFPREEFHALPIERLTVVMGLSNELRLVCTHCSALSIQLK